LPEFVEQPSRPGLVRKAGAGIVHAEVVVVPDSQERNRRTRLGELRLGGLVRVGFLELPQLGAPDVA
jgi:hypothetical protein